MDRSIGIRQLRQQLSRVVAAATSGEQITITMRGKPVASIGPAEQALSVLTLEALSAAGLIEPPRRSDRPETPEPHLLPADVRLDRVLDQVRGRT